MGSCELPNFYPHFSINESFHIRFVQAREFIKIAKNFLRIINKKLINTFIMTVIFNLPLPLVTKFAIVSPFL